MLLTQLDKAHLEPWKTRVMERQRPIAASGEAVPTTVDLAFSAAADKYAFKISDGSTTATVRATEVWADGKADMATPTATAAGSDDADTLPEAETILAEITSALSAANMSHIVASIVR